MGLPVNPQFFYLFVESMKGTGWVLISSVSCYDALLEEGRRGSKASLPSSRRSGPRIRSASGGRRIPRSPVHLRIIRQPVSPVKAENMIIDSGIVLSYNTQVGWTVLFDHARDRRTEMATLTAREAGDLLDLEHIEVIRRIRRGEIEAKKKGWFWLIKEEEVEKVKRKQWYKNLMALRAKRSNGHP
jgi:hypothetical protein